MEGKNTENMPPPCKKARKANWTNKEIWILLEEVRLEKVCLMSTLTNEITNRKKSAIWQRIADTLAASCGVEHRSLVSVREKWGTLKSEAQRRRDKKKATGGGAVKECEYDNIIFDILGEGSDLADGIDDGRDMFSIRTTQNCAVLRVPVELVEEEVAASSQGKSAKDANRGKKKYRKNAGFGSPLGEEYLKSEIEKNKSTIEVHKSTIEVNKSTIEANKSIVELNKLRMDVLRKTFLRKDDKFSFDCVTYV